MGKIATLFGAVLVTAAWVGALGAPASAQFSSGDPRFESDPREEFSDPRETADPREADVLAREAEQIETLSQEALFDALYDKGEREELATAFQQSSWDLLPYLDEMCDRWHDLVDAGALTDEQRRQEADALRERCLDMSELADTVTGETTFFLYAKRQFSWSDAERATFREGQADYERALNLVDEAVDTDDLNLALTPLQRALTDARTVGDTWGQTLALTLSARIRLANDDLQSAAETMKEGLRLARQIHDLDTVWEALSLRYEAAIQERFWNQAQATLTDQYQLAVEIGDDESAEQILDRLISLDEYLSTVGN